MTRSPPAVEVTRIELVRVTLPLVRVFRTSFGVQTERDVLLVHIDARGVDGWGECVTPAAPVYSSEYTDGAAHVLEHHLVPALLAGGPTVAGDEVPERLGGFKGHHMARAALEVAVLDAALRTAGIPLATHLGGVRDRVPAGVSVGIPDGGVPELVEQVAGYLDEGYRRIKIKVRPGFDAEPVAALRDRFGDALPLQVDANAGYDADDPSHVAALDRLDEMGLELIEQPFGPSRLRDHARMAARWRTPVCLDESIEDAVEARDAIDAGACGIINIKLGRVGGIVESVRIHDLCRRRGVPVWCGGMLETGVGRAANVGLASLPGFTLPGDTSASDRYWAEDLTEPFQLDDGHLAVPTAPGLGRSPRDETLRGARRVRLHGSTPAAETRR